VKVKDEGGRMKDEQDCGRTPQLWLIFPPSFLLVMGVTATKDA
jgi:hypothetical protein